MLVSGLLTGCLHKTLRLAPPGVGISAVVPSSNSVPAPPEQKVKITNDGYSLGRGDAPLTLVEFADYQCAYCARFHTAAFERIRKEYVETGRLRFVARDFPLNSHTNALKAAETSHCAGEQGSFWPMRNLLIANTNKLDGYAILTYARQIELDMSRFQACFDGERFLPEIRRDIAEAGAVGITGTPSFVLGKTGKDGIEGIKIVGAVPFEVFEKKISEVLSPSQPNDAPAGAARERSPGVAALSVPPAASAARNRTAANPHAPACSVCEKEHWNPGDHTWECVPKPAGTLCDDGDPCTSGDHCDGNGSCVGTLSCVPGIPGAISGGSSSTTGAYVLSWGASSGIVDRYSLDENGASVYAGTALSASIAGRGDGPYKCDVKACNSAGCSGSTPDFVVAVLLPPGVPSINAPSESGPSYVVTWSAPSGPVDHYDFGEAVTGSNWTTTSVTSTSESFTDKPYGT